VRNTLAAGDDHGSRHPAHAPHPRPLGSHAIEGAGEGEGEGEGGRESEREREREREREKEREREREREAIDSAVWPCWSAEVDMVERR